MFIFKKVNQFIMSNVKASFHCLPNFHWNLINLCKTFNRHRSRIDSETVLTRVSLLNSTTFKIRFFNALFFLIECRHLYDSQSEINGSAEIQIRPFVRFDSMRRLLKHTQKKREKLIVNTVWLIAISQNETEWTKLAMTLLCTVFFFFFGINGQIKYKRRFWRKIF